MRELLAIDCMPGGGPNPPPVGHFLRLAGDMPAPKRTLPESLVAGSCARTMLAGAIPAPKRTRRGSAIFLEGLRTTGCFLLDMGFLLECGFDEVQIANTAPEATAFARCLHREAFINPPWVENNERFALSEGLLGGASAVAGSR